MEVLTWQNLNSSRKLHRFAFPWLWRHQDFPFSAISPLSCLNTFLPVTTRISYLFRLSFCICSEACTCPVPPTFQNSLEKCSSTHSVNLSRACRQSLQRHHSLCLLLPCFSKITNKGYCSEQGFSPAFNFKAGEMSQRSRFLKVLPP